MYIKEKDEQRMVIGYTLGEQLFLICWNVGLIGSIIAAQFIPILVLRVIVSIILFGLLVFKGFVTNIVIDKLSETINIKRQHLWFIHRWRVAKYSDVINVSSDYKLKDSYEGGGEPAWQVYIQIIGDRLEIAHEHDEARMFDLAREISSFMGKELSDLSRRHDA